MTAPASAPDLAQLTTGDDDVDHVACLCSPDWSLCGLDVSGLEWGDDECNPCALCVIAAEEAPCPRCGGDLGGGE